MSNNINKKICFVASSGGHLEELLMLKPLIKESDIIITEKTSIGELNCNNKVIYVSQINRKEKTFIFKFIKLFFQSIKILISENPKYIVSTGALVSVPIMVLGKMFGKKTIYIESFARITEASLTGKILYKFVDLFFVQWEEMLKVYPNAKYVGGLF